MRATGKKNTQSSVQRLNTPAIQPEKPVSLTLWQHQSQHLGIQSHFNHWDVHRAFQRRAVYCSVSTQREHWCANHSVQTPHSYVHFPLSKQINTETFHQRTSVSHGPIFPYFFSKKCGIGRGDTTSKASRSPLNLSFDSFWLLAIQAMYEAL